MRPERVNVQFVFFNSDVTSSSAVKETSEKAEALMPLIPEGNDAGESSDHPSAVTVVSNG